MDITESPITFTFETITVPYSNTPDSPPPLIYLSRSFFGETSLNQKKVILMKIITSALSASGAYSVVTMRSSNKNNITSIRIITALLLLVLMAISLPPVSGFGVVAPSPPPMLSRTNNNRFHSSSVRAFDFVLSSFSCIFHAHTLFYWNAFWTGFSLFPLTRLRVQNYSFFFCCRCSFLRF
jgi:hypothetical protein